MANIGKHIANGRKRLGMHVSNVRFCPMCGCESLFRDDYKNSNPNKTLGIEYWCGTCGFGFAVALSRRVRLAEEMARNNRKLRTTKDFIERDLPPETLAYIREHGAESVLWRPT